MPGMLNTVSVRIAPPNRMPRSRPKDRHDRRDCGPKTVLEHDGPLGKSLGARSADVVLTHRLGQGAAREPRIDRCERGRENEPGQAECRYNLAGIGQDVAGQGIRPLTFEDREQLAEVLREEVERHESEPEDRG